MRRFHVLPGMLLALLASFALGAEQLHCIRRSGRPLTQTPAAIVDVIDTSPAPLTLQVQQREWTQSDGRDGPGRHP